MAMAAWHSCMQLRIGGARHECVTHRTNQARLGRHHGGPPGPCRLQGSMAAPMIASPPPTVPMKRALPLSRSTWYQRVARAPWAWMPL